MLNDKQDQEDEQAILLLVSELGKIRQVPQFLFADTIREDSTIEVRREIIQYKKSGKSTAEIDFIINSPGGTAHDAYRIIRTLRNNFDIVNVIVPFWAKSAATLLALGGTNIVMDEFGEFGPLDIQLAKERDDSPDYDRESALNDEYSLKRVELRAVEQFQLMFTSIYGNSSIRVNKNELTKRLASYTSNFYKPLVKQINPYKLGDKKRKLEIGEQYAKRILALYHTKISDNEEARKLLIDYLVNRCPDHGYVIDYSLISLFLPEIVKRSAIFGVEYENSLSDLAGQFLEIGEEFEYIGFVEFPSITNNNDATESVDESSQAIDKRNNSSKSELKNKSTNHKDPQNNHGTD